MQTHQCDYRRFQLFDIPGKYFRGTFSSSIRAFYPPLFPRFIVPMLLVTLSLMMSPLAQAVDCFAPSPSIKKNVDIYEDIQTRALTKAEYEELSQLFKNMRGAWSGKAHKVTCRGEIDAPREETTDYSLDTDVDTKLKNAIIIKSSLHSSEKKQSYQEKLTYFLTPERLGITEFTRAGDVELINVAPNFLVYLRKENKRTPAGGLVAQEFVRSIALYDHSLMVEDLNYSNGLLDSKNTWTLSRK